MSVLCGTCFTPVVLHFNKSGRAEQSTMKIKLVFVDKKRSTEPHLFIFGGRAEI